jgi:hypothetical protein
MVFGPAHLSRPSLDPGSMKALDPDPTARGRAKEEGRHLVPVGATNRDQRLLIYPGWCLQPGLMAVGLIGPDWSHQLG